MSGNSIAVLVETSENLSALHVRGVLTGVIVMKTIGLFMAVVAFAPIAIAANQTFIYQGTFSAVSTTLTNPYDSGTASFTGTYNLNTGTYVGQGTGNTLLMTNSSDFITLDSGGTPNVQTVVDVQRIITGNGNDVVDMASSNFSLPGTAFFGGTGNELIWANVGGDTLTLGNGTDAIDAGPGDDLINTGTGHDIIEGGTGTDTAAFVLTESAYTITRTGPNTFTITGLSNTTVADLSNVEFAQFSDQTLDLSTVPFPEPSGLAFLGCGVVALGSRRSRSRRGVSGVGTRVQTERIGLHGESRVVVALNTWYPGTG